MNTYNVEVNGLNFYCREGTSDEKTVREVVGKQTYKRRKFDVEAGENWIDLGGNIGAFAVLAASKGTYVTVYEPDPLSASLIDVNKELNYFDNNQIKIIQKAVVHDDTKVAKLNLSKTNQFWRNSLVKDWKGGSINVECVNFKDILFPHCNIKMDIEGSEMLILESDFDGSLIDKMVFEWSFDMDKNINRYRNVLEKLKNQFTEVRHRNYKGDLWQDSWFPPCTNVFCLNDKYAL